MAKKRKQTSQDAALAAVRRQSREAAVGKGVPGSTNFNRSVRFKTPTDKYDARGRSHRGDW